MKFEEKLMKLRKEHALSQEELAEKLDVTRQTISKWELGQSKPDMEKLMKISTVFNISIECLTDDTKEINKNIKGGNTMDKPIIKILIIVLGVIVLAYFIIQAFFGAAIFKLFENTFGKIFGTAFGTDEDVLNTFTTMFNQALDVYENSQETINNTVSEDFSNEVDEFYNSVSKEEEHIDEKFNTVYEQKSEEFNQLQSDFEKNQEQALNQIQSTFDQIQQMQQNMLNR